MTTYTPADAALVADLIGHNEAAFKYVADDQLETIIAHADLIHDVARYEHEIGHSTEYLDVLLAEKLAALSVLARRRHRGYAIERGRPGGIDRNLLDDLKRRVSVESLVRSYGAELHKVGRGFMSRCPYPDHDDRYPSFRIYQDTNSVWCFGCQRGGDVFDLVMLVEGLDFRAAAQKVAAIAGVDLTPGSSGSGKLRGRLRDVA